MLVECTNIDLNRVTFLTPYSTTNKLIRKVLYLLFINVYGEKKFIVELCSSELILLITIKFKTYCKSCLNHVQIIKIIHMKIKFLFLRF